MEKRTTKVGDRVIVLMSPKDSYKGLYGKTGIVLAITKWNDCYKYRIKFEDAKNDKSADNCFIFSEREFRNLDIEYIDKDSTIDVLRQTCNHLSKDLEKSNIELANANTRIDKLLNLLEGKH